MTEIRKTIIENIKKVCTVNGIKNIDIAEHMGVSAGSVSNWFKGTNFLDVDNLYKLCQYLGVSMNQIFGMEPILNGTLNTAESELLTAYRAADSGTKASVRKLLDIPEKSKETDSSSARTAS